MFFLLLVSVLFRRPLTFLKLVGGIGGQRGIKLASASSQSANEPARTSFYSIQLGLKPIIKAQIPGKLVYSGISDVEVVTISSDKTRLKKLMIMIIIIIY